MQTFVRHSVEVIASVWLVLVAVQYAASCLMPGLGVYYAPAYWVMLAMLVLAGGYRLSRKAE